MAEGKWVPVAERYPEEKGTYRCKITNKGRDFEADRILAIANGHYHWFGGCRPFTDHDVITHWLETTPND